MEEKEISSTSANSRMEPIHAKEVLSLLYKVDLSFIQNEEDASLKYAIEGATSMVEGITICSKKQTSILIFFSLLSVFYNIVMLHWSSRVKRVLILNIAYFVTLIVRKCLHVLIKQGKR